MKKVFNVLLVAAMAAGGITPIFVSAQGAPTQTGRPTAAAAAVNASGSANTGADFCSALAQRLGRVEANASSTLDKLESREADMTTRLQSRWDNYFSNLSKQETKTDTRFAADIQKLNERASSTDQKAAVSEFRSAVQTAINTRNGAVRDALTTFRDGVAAAFAARGSSTIQAFVDRINALKAAAAKARTDCANDFSARTVRQGFVSALQTAQKNFASAKKAESDFGATMKELTATKNDAFRSAQSDFKASLTQAVTALKAALGNSNASSTHEMNASSSNDASASSTNDQATSSENQ